MQKHSTFKEYVTVIENVGWLQLELRMNPIPVKYIVYTQFMVASALLKDTVSIEECMAVAIFVK